MMPGAEVMIAGGGHQFQHGRLRSLDSKSFTLPFAHVQLRGIEGTLLKNRWAFVPAKYLVEFDVEAMREQTMRDAAARFGLDSQAYKRVIKQLETAHEA
jgi:DNA-binding MarR family transcriptional regulator